ncbi:MAG: hypothetical protein P4L36_08900 [Holophaga sp.]|nr:hypothetical protein [Holophaga sp.]
MFNISYGGLWPVIEVRFTAATETHLYKHTHESPEIQPHFVERILLEAEPRFFYPDHVAGRYVFEGYLLCMPYRVVVEALEENGLIIFFPISAHRISHKVFIRRMRQQER